MLGTAPAVGFALAGGFSPLLSRRIGLEPAMLLSIVVMVAGHAGRSLASRFPAFFIFTALALCAAGVGGVLIPAYIKLHFPRRAGAAMALYICMLSVGTALPPVLAVPVSSAVGWRASLAIWAAVAACAAIPWAAAWRRSRRTALRPPPAGQHVPDLSPVLPTRRRRRRGIFGSRIFWALTILQGMNTFSTFTVFAWLPVLLAEDSDMPVANIGWLLGLFPIITIPLALALPLFLARLSRQDIAIHFFGLFMVIGWGGLLLFPRAAPLAWVLSIAIGSGLFVIHHVLVVLRTRDYQTTARVSGYSLTAGYLFGATGPLLVGLLVGWTGTWTAALAVMLGSTALVFAAGWVLRDGSHISGATPAGAPDPTVTPIQQSTSIGES